MYITVSSSIILLALIAYSLYRSIVSFGDFFSLRKELRLLSNVDSFSTAKLKIIYRLREAKSNAIIYTTSFLMLSVVLIITL